MSVQDTLTQRGTRYGSFAENARVTDSLVSVMTSTPNWASLTPSQRTGLTLIVHKIARMLTGDPTYTDNPHDIAGYATLIEQDMQADQPPTAQDAVPGNTVLQFDHEVNLGDKTPFPAINMPQELTSPSFPPISPSMFLAAIEAAKNKSEPQDNQQ